MNFLALPELFTQYLEHIDTSSSKGDTQETANDQESEGNEEFIYYIDEIKEAIANQETLSSIIAAVMEAIAFGLEFDRVLYLVPISSPIF